MPDCEYLYHSSIYNNYPQQRLALDEPIFEEEKKRGSFADERQSFARRFA